MHLYSINVTDRTKMLYVIVPLSLFVGWALNNFFLGQLEWYQTYSWIADIPSSGLALLGIFYKFTDLYFWKWLVRMGFFKTPDLAGKYEGELYSSRDDKTDPTSVTIRVEQTLTKIQVYLSTSISSSRSEMASILIDEPDGPLLIYEYLNDHQKIADSALTIHRGLARLSLCKEENRLSGTYYTSPQRGNYGVINVNKV